MGKRFLDDDDFLDNGGGQIQKNRRRKRGRSFSFPRFSVPASWAWYDCVMVPLLILSGLYVVFNFADVTFFFFKLTIWMIDLAFVLIAILLLVLVIALIFRRRRRFYY